MGLRLRCGIAMLKGCHSQNDCWAAHPPFVAVVERQRLPPGINHINQIFFVTDLAKSLNQGPFWWGEVGGILPSTNEWSIPKQFGVDRELHRDFVVPVAKGHFVSIELGVVGMDPNDSVSAHHVVERVFQTADSGDAVGYRGLGPAMLQGPPRDTGRDLGRTFRKRPQRLP